MSVRTSLKIAGKAAFAMTMLMSPSVLAADDSLAILAQNSRAIEGLTSIGTQLKAVLTPEIGFPSDYIEPWQAAVDAAFSEDLLEADFLAALEARLSEDTIDAALAFDNSPLGRELLDLVVRSQPLEDDPESLAQARERVDAGSVEENGVFVDLFEAQAGARRADAAMDIYFRAMVTAAEPIIGLEAAEQWVAGADALRETYVEDYFLTTVAIYGQLPQDRLEEAVDALQAPEIVDYAEQLTAALAETMHAAADRLEIAYSAELDRR